MKSFVLLLGRSRKRITIGRYPTISLSEARARAREIVAGRLLGKEEATLMKFEDAITIFIASRYGEDYIKPRTRDETERLLRRHFLPKFRYEQLSAIKTHEIADIIDKLRKTPVVRHRAFGAIRLFFRWAEGRRYVLRSPCVGLEPPPLSTPRDRFLSRDELKVLLTELRKSTSTYVTLLELLLLTGQRRGEIVNLRADWIDWEKRTMTFPGAVVKNRRQHTVPFGARAEELLKRGEPKGLLFLAAGTDGKRSFCGWSKAKDRLDQAAPIPPWTIHDLRRTFATNMAALGTPVAVTEKLLNHVSGMTGGIVAIYQRHTYEREMREVMQLWDLYLKDLIREPQGEFRSEGHGLQNAA